MLIAMAGLPGTGKTTLATELARRLSAIVLNKDHIRASLFPPEAILYTREQDDFVMSVIYQTAEFLIGIDRNRHIIIDGRTFSKRYQVADLLAMATKIGVPYRIIECVCDDVIVDRRLTMDRESGTHLAANRTVEWYRTLKANADTILEPKLVIDTGTGEISTLVEGIIAEMVGV